ncbi:MAG: efflux RND transporter periplasmic adaptor subunit [Patescibacteria group bacterium]|nr:efflux RND transporter periplasmic adaptor subunit [Patescibacteria group bacterium]
MAYKLSKRSIILIAVITVLAGGIYFYTQKGEESPYDVLTVERGDLVQEVSVTGKVTPFSHVDLAFEKSGRVADVYADVGDRVLAGATVVRLENAETYALLLQAQANLSVAQAQLAELQKGTRSEEITVQETRIANAKKSLDEAKKDLSSSIQDSFTKADNAVRNYADQVFVNPHSANPSFNFTLANSQLKTDIEWQRLLVEEVLISWEHSLVEMADDPVRYLDAVISDTQKIKEFLDKVSLAVNSLTPTSALSQTTIDGYKANIVTARTAIYTATTNLALSRSKFVTAQSDLELQSNELALKKAGATVEQIAAEEARVKSQEAQVANYQAQLAKTLIRAPFSGIVTEQNAKVGEVVSPAAVMVRIISESRFEIEALVPEADIANVKLGDKATFTLDAYGDREVFEALVQRIDPAETVVEGVSTYKVILEFIDHEGKVKSGMTADVSILTDKREDIIALPTRAVSVNEGEQSVRVLHKDGTIETRKVTTGLRGSDGKTEILSGIEEGEEVIVFEYK